MRETAAVAGCWSLREGQLDPLLTIKLLVQNDELSRRLAKLEAATRHSPDSNVWLNSKEGDEDDLELDQQLDQVLADHPPALKLGHMKGVN